ncbi:hypothetical protein [Tritonibacter scottomollicae]|uniref:Uncharacterized protein n=1 Tax=Tritonibacter scottomollicae TaxID=483013 RepID=A0A2T1AHH5_TRISK|nr:hypothetical protein [Tritonibacter scottomollicae]PRZ48006.1 hypothetical protein CLV89_105231 [Tritonibacter scottomollicae]
MGSSSSSSNQTQNVTEDRRVATDAGSIGVSASGDVAVNVVADEAFELGEQALAFGEEALWTGSDALESAADLVQGALSAQDEHTARVTNTLSTALKTTQQMAKTEEGQISELIVKIGIPAAALAFIASKVLK